MRHRHRATPGLLKRRFEAPCLLWCAALVLPALIGIASCAHRGGTGTAGVNMGLDTITAPTGRTSPPAPAAAGANAPMPKRQASTDKLAADVEQSAAALRRMLDEMHRKPPTEAVAAAEPPIERDGPRPGATPVVERRRATAADPPGRLTADAPPTDAARSEGPLGPPPPDTNDRIEAPAAAPPTIVAETPLDTRWKTIAARLNASAPPNAAAADALAGLLASIERLPEAASLSALEPRLEQARRAAAGPPSVRITAELCERVTGFGQFEPLPATRGADTARSGSAVGYVAQLYGRVIRFVQPETPPATRLAAGRLHPAIVYVEVDGFTSRAVSLDGGGPGYAVDLSLEAALYHDAEGVVAWTLPTAHVTDTSRRPRRDFYLTQRIDFPANLTIGRYRLKVTVRDRATGSQDESSILVEVVSEPRSLPAAGGERVPDMSVP